MSYALEQIEVSRPLERLRLPRHAEGVALVVRRRGRPIGFVMEPLPPATAELSPERIGEIIAPHVAAKLVMESLRDELPAVVRDSALVLPPLTIAVCTKDRPERLARLLDSLATMPRGEGPIEVLVVDNAPSDSRTRELVMTREARFPLPLRYACEPCTGLDFARNLAITEATGDLLAFLDDDVEVTPDWYAGLTEAYGENPDAAAFTGLVLPLELTTPAQVLFELRGGFGRGFDKLRYHGQKMPGNPLYPCGAGIFGAGANMVFRRQVLRDLGGFDPALDTGRHLPGGGDLDIFYRVIRAGHPLVYEPRCLVLHEHRRETAELRRQYWSWGLGFMAFVGKSYRTDPPMRPRLRALVVWWFKDQLAQLHDSFRRRHTLPSYLLRAELWGGVRGLFGEYGRSRRRVARLDRLAAASATHVSAARVRVASEATSGKRA